MKMFYYDIVTFGTPTHTHHEPLWLLCPVSPAKTCWDTLYAKFRYDRHFSTLPSKHQGRVEKRGRRKTFPGQTEALLSAWP